MSDLPDPTYQATRPERDIREDVRLLLAEAGYPTTGSILGDVRLLLNELAAAERVALSAVRHLGDLLGEVRHLGSKP